MIFYMLFNLFFLELSVLMRAQKQKKKCLVLLTISMTAGFCGKKFFKAKINKLLSPIYFEKNIALKFDK